MDIQVYVVSPSAELGVCLRSSYPVLAILEYDIIEWEVVVFTIMCLAALAAESASVWSTAVQECLIGISLEGLTTILLPCTSVQGNYIIAHLFDCRNS